MIVNAFLSIYTSRRDIYGNCYHAAELVDADTGQTIGKGTIHAQNIDTIECREKLHWNLNYRELPIREFNRLTKNWRHLGCSWSDIKTGLLSQNQNKVDALTDKIDQATDSGR